VNELVVKNIPIEVYQTADFNAQAQLHVKNLFEQAITEMKILPTEEILLCTGNIFDKARDFLKEKGYSVQDAKIEGFMQNVVEKVYLDHLVNDIGIPRDEIPTESGKDRFFALFHWIGKDFPRREIYVKSGFDKWGTKWREMAHQDWMRFVTRVDEPSTYNEDDEEVEMGEDQSDAGEKPFRSHGHKGTHPHKHQKSSAPSKSSHPKKFGKKSSQGKHSRSGPSSHGHERKYSSTDPDPRRKLF